jgi:predicted nicotinamide N-methyase
MTDPFLYETPLEALSTLHQRTVTVGDRDFHLTLPVDIDELLDHPATHAAFEQDEYMPYWAELWPAAQMLGTALIAHPWPAAMTALEIGCGLGLSGLVALSLGMRVIFSDYDRAALRFAAQNAQANGFSTFETRPMDWRHPPADLHVPLILAADVLYEARNIQPITRLIAQLLCPTGECWLVDPNRPYAHEFCTALKHQGLRFNRQAMTCQRPGQSVKGTLYRICQRRPDTPKI